MPNPNPNPNPNVYPGVCCSMQQLFDFVVDPNLKSAEAREAALDVLR